MRDQRRPATVLGLPRVVILTGGSSGIGLASAVLFAREGWRVGLISRGQAGLDAAVTRIEAAVPGAAVAAFAADVTDPPRLAAAAEALIARLGPIDVWVNAAGNGVYGRFAEVPEAQFRRVTEVTYLGTVNGCRVALSHMQPRDRGMLVNVCSAVVFHGVPLLTSYSGAKAAVRGFGQSLGLELKLSGSRVRVSTLFPPAINSPFFDHAVSHMGFPARPVPPVYGCEVAARGVLLAATRTGGGVGELKLTGVVVAYSWIARLSLGLARTLVGKSDFASELPRDGQARPDLKPCLWEPKTGGFEIDGPFGSRARGWSTQVGVLSVLRRIRRRAPRSPPAPARAEPGPGPAGCPEPPGNPSDRHR